MNKECILHRSVEGLKRLSVGNLNLDDDKLIKLIVDASGVIITKKGDYVGQMD